MKLTQEEKELRMLQGDFSFAHDDGNENYFSGKERLNWASPWPLSNSMRYVAACNSISDNAKKVGKLIKERDSVPPYYVLDVGCSSGTLAKFWYNHYQKMSKPRLAILGLEIDDGRIARGLEFGRTLTHKGLRLDVLKHDLVTDPLDEYRRKTHQFGDAFVPDCINAQEVLEHIGRDAALLFIKEAAAVLNPKGILILSTPAPRKDEGEMFVWPETHAYEFSRPELRELVQDMGWVIKQEMGWFGNGIHMLKRATREQKKLYKELSNRVGSGVAVSTLAVIYPELAICQQLVLQRA